jgi:hypothetical protein
VGKHWSVSITFERNLAMKAHVHPVKKEKHLNDFAGRKLWRLSVELMEFHANRFVEKN